MKIALKKISNGFYKISTGVVTLACLLIFLVFSSLVLPDQAAKAESYAGEAGSPDTSLFYTSKDLYRFAEANGEEGRTAYICARFTFDVIWPITYLIFLATSISWLLRKANLHSSKWGLLNLAPVFGTVFDFIENSMASIVMGRYPQTTIVIDGLAGVFTLLKWVFIAGSFVVLVASVLLMLFHLKNRKKII